jgi:transposase
MLPKPKRKRSWRLPRPQPQRSRLKASNASGRHAVRCRIHLPRERLVHPAPTACSCCGSTALRKIGEDVTETLEHVPSSWKGDPARAREVLVPLLRDDRADAGTFAPCP